MTRCVIDASAALTATLRGRPHRKRARSLLAEKVAAGVRLVAPPLFESESDGAIIELIVRGVISRDEGNRLFAALEALPVHIETAPGVRRRAREIALAHGEPRCYDATYAALATECGCEFWTADYAFFRIVRKRHSNVKYIGHYRS